MILADIREALYDVVVPHINSEDNIVKFNKYLNEIQERFINSGKWKGTTREIAIAATDYFITLPPRFSSCLAARFSATNTGNLVDIKSQWFKYLPGGSYLWSAAAWASAGYTNKLADMGDGFCTFTDAPYAKYYLKFTRENVGDNNLQVLVKGNDENGDAIFTDVGGSSYEGIIVTLNAATVTTTQQFSGQISFLQKHSSQGYIKLEAVDVATAAVTTIGRYMPGETIVNYRRYATGGTTGDTSTVNAICKLRYIPCKLDSDEVIPSNLGALKNGLSALKYEAEGDKQMYKTYFADGLNLLNDEVREARGGAQFSLRIDPAAFQFNRLYPGR